MTPPDPRQAEKSPGAAAFRFGFIRYHPTDGGMLPDGDRDCLHPSRFLRLPFLPFMEPEPLHLRIIRPSGRSETWGWKIAPAGMRHSTGRQGPANRLRNHRTMIPKLHPRSIQHRQGHPPVKRAVPFAALRR